MPSYYDRLSNLLKIELVSQSVNPMAARLSKLKFGGFCTQHASSILLHKVMRTSFRAFIVKKLRHLFQLKSEFINYYEPLNTQYDTHGLSKSDIGQVLCHQ